MKVCIALILAGALIVVGSAVALARGGDARGGQAVPVTSKAPHQPKLVRGWIGAVVSGSPSRDGLVRP